MLGRHPSEVPLGPRQIAELRALRELRNRDVCPSCLRKALLAQLERTCDVCGGQYQDEETQTALSNLK